VTLGQTTRISSDQRGFKEYGRYLYEQRGGWAYEKAVLDFCTNIIGQNAFMCFVSVQLDSANGRLEDNRELRPDVAAWGTEQEIAITCDLTLGAGNCRHG